MAATTTVLIAPPPLGTPFLDERGRVTQPWAVWLIAITSTGSVVEGLTSTVAGALLAANNLADVPDTTAARLNLGLGSAAVHSAADFDVSGAAAAAQAAAIAASDPIGAASAAQAAAIAASDPVGAAAAVLGSSAQKSANLSDLGNASTARTNLGLGTAAQQNTTAFDAAGAAAAAVAAIPNADATHTGTLTAADWNTFNNKQAALGFTPLNPANNLSEVTPATARGNLGLATVAATGAYSDLSGLPSLGTAAAANLASFPAGTFAAGWNLNGQTFSGNGTFSGLLTFGLAKVGTNTGFSMAEFSYSTLFGTGTTYGVLHDSLGRLYLNGTTGSYVSLRVNNVEVARVSSTGLAVSGSVTAPIATKSAAYTATTSDFSILADATSAAFSVTLPASPLTGQVVNVKKIDASANAVTVAGNGKNIDGAASQSLAAQWAKLQIQYNGTAWFTL